MRTIDDFQFSVGLEQGLLTELDFDLAKVLLFHDITV